MYLWAVTKSFSKELSANTQAAQDYWQGKGYSIMHDTVGHPSYAFAKFPPIIYQYQQFKRYFQITVAP